MKVTLEKAIQKVGEEYVRAIRLSFVRKPISYALFQAWRFFDQVEEEKPIMADKE